jgi:PPK2 family polyphosphate:nucleotide phosphotransferase
MQKFSKISTKAPEKLDKEETKLKTAKILEKLGELQNILFAQGKYSLMIVLQGLDASGKDGVVKNVFSGLNPLGVDVRAFKAPTEEEKSYDFLWRIHKCVPAKGTIMLLNRSHYEDVLVPTVEKWIDKDRTKSRFQHINNFESLLQEENNTIILKFYLHISKEKQHEKLLERKNNPEKFWKHSDGDWETSKKWDSYMNAYQDVFAECDKPEWEIIPADQNWYKEYRVAKRVLETLEKLDLKYPKLATAMPIKLSEKVKYEVIQKVKATEKATKKAATKDNTKDSATEKVSVNVSTKPFNKPVKKTPKK